MEHSLSAIERREFGKGPAKVLRREGKVPAIVYGRGEPLHIALDSAEFAHAYRDFSRNTVVSLNMGKKLVKAIIRDIQENIVSDQVEHIDFYEFEEERALQVTSLISLVGNSVGVREGGKLEQRLSEFKIECLARDLPDVIEVDISEVQQGQNLCIRDVTPPEGVTILNRPDQVVAHVAKPKRSAGK